MDSDQQQQDDEVLAVRAIYGDSFFFDRASRTCTVEVAGVSLVAYLPSDYPSTSAPVLEVRGGALHAREVERLTRRMHELFTPGEVVLFSWVQCLVDQSSSWTAESQPEEPAVQLHDSPERFEQQLPPQEAAPSSLTNVLEILHGEPVTISKSTFQAHAAAVHSLADVEAVMAILLQNSKIKRATHNMLAYRIRLDRQSTFLQDSDDDGEAQAGTRLLHLLQVMDAQDVMVVVSRWFGGVLLGPARFTHINNAARALLEQCSLVQRPAHVARKKGR